MKLNHKYYEMNMKELNPIEPEIIWIESIVAKWKDRINQMWSFSIPSLQSIW